jgi:hypothetical protein
MDRRVTQRFPRRPKPGAGGVEDPDTDGPRFRAGGGGGGYPVSANLTPTQGGGPMCDDEQKARPEPIAGESGAEEPPWGARFTEDGQIVWEAPEIPLGSHARPKAYYPDGEPILDDELLPATLKWAMLFEQRNKERIVGQTRTLYGERLSTVWLGLDHNFFGTGPPLIYETMLFAPADRDADVEYITRFFDKTPDPEKDAGYNRRRAYIAKYYPHDQLQLRYSTREEAQAMHRRLRLHCLIPPTLRAYLLGKLAGITLWQKDEDVRPEEDQ